MHGLLKRFALGAFSLALVAAPVVANACTTCISHSVCNLDGANCTIKMTCTTDPGPCPLLA